MIAVGVACAQPMSVSAQPTPPRADDPADRVRFLPDPGLSLAARAVVRENAPGEPSLSGDTRAWLSDTTGVEVQNLGTRPTRVLAVYHLPEGPRGDPCLDCAFSAARCGAPLAPGATTRVAAWWTPEADEPGAPAPVVGLLSAVYALNQHPAADFGPAWSALVDEAGLAGDASVADLVCTALAPESPFDWEEACPSRALLAAFTRRAPLPFAPDAPPAPLAGEPIAAVAAPLVEVGSSTSPSATLDRYRAPGLTEVDAPIAAGTLGTPPHLAGERGAWVYELPGAVGNNPEGIASLARLHHPGLTPGCATVRIEAWRTGGGFRGAITTTLASGAWTTIDARRPEWNLTGTASLRIVSDSPLAASLTTRGYGFSLSRPATPASETAVRQLVPLAYQAFRPFLFLATALDDSDPTPLQDAQPGARGWETNIAAFNPVPDRRDLVLRLQGAGRPSRDSGFPMDPRTQLVFQPGFGLGKPGGPGWAEISARTIDGAAASPVAVAVDALRSATDLPYLMAGWGLPSEPDPQDIRTIGLPTLGGPAVGEPNGIQTSPPPILAPARRFTTTLAARIAVQNPTTATARVAIDAYAPCGLAGTTELRLDPRQSAHLPVRELEGIAFAPNTALLRILEGQVSAVLETQHVERLSFASAPPDLATAYRGTPIRSALDPPTAPTATLTVTPTTLSFHLPDTPTTASLTIDGTTQGCAAWHAETSAPWLELTPPRGLLPGGLTVRLLPDALPPPPPGTDTLHTTIRLRPAPPAKGPTLTIPVTVIPPPPPPPQHAFLPMLMR